MIDERMLKSIISNFNDPSFSVFITNFTQDNECNKDTMIIDLEQVTPNLYKVVQTKEYIIDQLIELLKDNDIDIPEDILDRNKEHINSVVDKKLIFDSNIALNHDKTFRSEINGYVDILGYGKAPTQSILGTIKNRLLEITKKDHPIYIPLDRFKVRDNVLYITVPNNIEDIAIKIDGRNKNYTKEENLITVPCENIHKGEHVFRIDYLLNHDITNQNIEVLITPLEKEIEIEFTEPHSYIPAVVLTVDKKDLNLYSDYYTEFIKDEETGKYTGLKLMFKNLRRKSSYPEINICILGE